MSRGRHRTVSPAAATTPVVAVGALAAGGAALVSMTSDPTTLRIGLGGSLVVSLGLSWLLRQRERDHASAMAIEVSARRSDASRFQDQLDLLRQALDSMQRQLEQFGQEAHDLSAEVTRLRVEKSDADLMLRRLRMERIDRLAREQQSVEPVSSGRFELAAATLESLRLELPYDATEVDLGEQIAEHAAEATDAEDEDTGKAVVPFAVLRPVGAVDETEPSTEDLADLEARDDSVIDLTAHDDTLAIELRTARLA